MPADTLLDIAIMHYDALIARGKLVQLWYKRIYNFSYKFFFDHDEAHREQGHNKSIFYQQVLKRLHINGSGFLFCRCRY